MRSLPPYIDGALFGFFFVPVMFFLKVICPLHQGCFADPFFILIFSPVFVLQFIVEKIGGQLSFTAEIAFLIFFWTLFGSLGAHLGSALMQREEDDGE